MQGVATTVRNNNVSAPDQVDLPERGTALPQIVMELVTSAKYVAHAHATTPERRPTDPDDDALDLVRKGDVTGALERLMQRHGAAVYRYCRVALNDAVLADDAQQQIFLEAFRDLPKFARRSTVRTWLLGIARHRVLDAVKQRRRTQAHVEADTAAGVPDPRASPGEVLDDARLLAALAACVAELDEPVRTAILLRYPLGLSYEEMAVICDEQPGTLQARVSRALRHLRDRIEARIRAAR